MSLIGDALRKARKEAAERESDRRGILFSAKISDGPGRSNLGLGLALGATIAVIATVAGGGAVWWLLSPDERTGSAEPASTATSGPPGVTTPTPIPSAPTPEAEVRTIPAVTAAPTPVTGASSRSDLETDRTDARPEVVADAHRPAAKLENDAGAVGFAGIENGEEVFVMEADLGGVRLSLDYIVSRPDDPFAEINGVELHLGGVIDGYRVKAIESDRVRLSNGRRTVVLRAP